VTGRALALVASAVAPGTLAGTRVARSVFEDDRTTAASISLAPQEKGDRTLLVVDRRQFDGALLHAARDAGAAYHAERVVDVSVSDGRPHVRTTAATYAGRWLIGADGANSLVRRRLQAPFRREQLSLASGVYARGRTDTAILVRFVAGPPGYIWSFPRADHLAIGICAQADQTRASPLRDTFMTWLQGSGLADRAQLEPYAWPIPSLSAADLAVEHPAGDGYLLVGDAAGLVDPITREGIYFALWSGARAADAIATASRPAHHYVGALREHVYPELARAARLKRGFFRGPFTRLLVDALRHSEAVRGVMIDLIAGVQPYRTLKRRLLRTFEWRLAWQLLLLEAQGARLDPDQRAR
jgi:flavin-dependent dehydrogenase